MLKQERDSKFIMVSEFFFPSQNSTSYFLTKICQEVGRHKRCLVVTSSNLEEAEELTDSNIEIIRHKHQSRNRSNLVHRLLSFIISTLKLTYHTVKRSKKGDVVFSPTNPAFLMLLLSWFKRMKGYKYILLVYDVFPENLIPAGILKKQSLLYKFVRGIYNRAYRRADRIVVIGRDMEELLQKKCNNKDIIHYIPNWAEPSLVSPAHKSNNPIIRKHGLEKKIVFTFAGNIGRVQGLDRLLEATCYVTNDQFQLLFIGEGAMKKSLEEKSLKRKLPVIFDKNYEIIDQNIFLNACDISVISLAPNMSGLGVPSKSYFNMASGHPLLFIGGSDSEISLTIKEHEIGWVISEDSPKRIAEKLDEICLQAAKYSKMGLKSREVSEKYYSMKIILPRYLDIILKEF